MRIVTRGLFVTALALTITAGAYAQETVDVTFRVDVSALVDACQHEVGTDNVFIRGDFNDWDESTSLEPVEGEASVYAVTLELYPDSTYGYKFWTSRDHWDDDPNRNYTVTDEADQVLPIATFRKEVEDICGANFEAAILEFSVNMETMIRSGDFDPETDVVVVAGTINGWNAGANPLEADFFEPNIYSTIVIDTLPVPSTVMFKFVTGVEGGDIGGWEGRDDREIEVTGEEERDSEGRLMISLDPVPYFNDATPDMLFHQDATVTFVVDARPAYYFLADSGYVPSDVQTAEEVPSFSTIFVNGPLSAVDDLDAWFTWGPNDLGQLESREFEPSETFDQDSTFVWTRTFNENQVRRWVGKLGLDGYDNENGFGADHVFVISDEADVTINMIFGAAHNQQEWRSDLYHAYIGFDDDGDPYVRRRPEAVSVESLGQLPDRIALEQNYPNPFNPNTTFEYTIDGQQHVTISVFDLLGREVATVVDEVQGADTYRVTFDAANLASGMYLYQLRTGGQVITRTMTLLK